MFRKGLDHVTGVVVEFIFVSCWKCDFQTLWLSFKKLNKREKSEALFFVCVSGIFDKSIWSTLTDLGPTLTTLLIQSFLWQILIYSYIHNAYLTFHHLISGTESHLICGLLFPTENLYFEITSQRIKTVLFHFT